MVRSLLLLPQPELIEDEFLDAFRSFQFKPNGPVLDIPANLHIEEWTALTFKFSPLECLSIAKLKRGPEGVHIRPAVRVSRERRDGATQKALYNVPFLPKVFRQDCMLILG